jgi:hypothetical protein
VPSQARSKRPKRVGSSASEIAQPIFFDHALGRFDAHRMQDIRGLFDDPDLVVVEFEPTRLVPVELVVDGVVTKADLLDLGPPVRARGPSDSLHRRFRCTRKDGESGGR